jgi:hypothetical protein
MMPVLSFKFPRPSFYRGVCPVPSVNFGKEHRHAEPSKRTAPAPLRLPLGRPAQDCAAQCTMILRLRVLAPRCAKCTQARSRRGMLLALTVASDRPRGPSRPPGFPRSCSLPLTASAHSVALSDTHWQPMTGSLSECQTATVPVAAGLQVRLRLGVRSPVRVWHRARPGPAGPAERGQCPSNMEFINWAPGTKARPGSKDG